MLYTNDPRAGHTGELPVIVPGVAGTAGLTVTARFLTALVPQELLAVTEMFPF